MNIDDKVRFSLFAPKSKKHLATDYPELRSNPMLKELNKMELFFCYYLGCETSPLNEWFNSTNKKKREQAIIKAADHSNYKIPDEDYGDFLEGRFPGHIQNGIESFMSYKLSVRMRAKRLQEKALENYEKIIDVDINGEQFFVTDKEGNPTAEKDYDKVNKYTTISLNVLKNMDELVNKIEYGYGIDELKDDNSKNDDDDISYIDLEHENKL